MDVGALRDEMAALRHVTYLNWGGSGPSPRRILEAQCRVLMQLNDEDGPMSVTALTQAGKYMNACREAVAGLLGCDPTEVALMESTSDGINRIAWGLDWSAGDEVIVTDLEHVSGVAPWFHLAERFGVKVVWAPSAEGAVDLNAILERVTARTRLVLLSHVSYISGALLPVQELAAEGDRRGFFVGVDGAQSVGQIPVDVHQLGVHFYALPGQKWLLGPDGTGALYVQAAALERLRPSFVGWASVASEKVADGVPFHPDARRYEVAGRHVPAFVALTEAVGCIRGVGVDAIAGRIRALANRLRAGLATIPGVRTFGPPDTGLVSVQLEAVDAAVCSRRLWNEHRVVVRWIDTPRLLRFSVHAFNTEDEVDYALDALRNVLA